MVNKELFLKVKELNLPIGKYALFGSAGLGVRGLKECNDVDIIVAGDLWEELKLKSGWRLEKAESGDQCLRKNEVEIFMSWAPGEWDVAKLIQEAEIIDGLPFVKLQDVLAWKKLRGKDKDLKDIETIEKFLLTKV